MAAERNMHVSGQKASNATASIVHSATNTGAGEDGRSLRRSGLEALVHIAGDILSISIWLGFLIYASLLWVYQDEFISRMPISAQRLVEAADILSTLFSILFAATFTRVTSALAQWLLEKGTTVRVLDQLFGSASVSSTLLAALSAARQSQLGTQVTGLGLVVLWLLSPLGSQAVLRLVEIVNGTISANGTFPYLNVSHWDNIAGPSSDAQLMLISPDTLLNAALISPLPSKMSEQDLWGHVKIPLLKDGAADQTGWTEVRADSADDYSSLIGIPIGLLPNSSNQSASLAIESWYWTLGCEQWYLTPSSNLSYPDQTFTWNTGIGYLADTQDYDFSAAYIYFNDTVFSNSRSADACGLNASFGTNTAYYACPELPPSEIAIAIPTDDGNGYRAARCKVGAQYVETKVACTGRVCAPTHNRKSTKPHLPSTWTPLDLYAMRAGINNHMPTVFLTNFVNAIAGRMNGGGGMAALAGYIVNPSDPFAGNNVEAVTTGTTTLSNISDVLATTRLAQVLNTYWVASVGSQLITGSDARYAQADNITLSFVFAPDNALRTHITADSSAVIETSTQKLRCDGRWLAIFTLTVIVSLIGSLLGVVIAFRLKSPRLSMNVSAILKGNPYLEGTENELTYLDDDTRAQLLGGMQVRLGDVEPHKAVGHIAMAPNAANNGVVVDRLRLDRLYR